MQIANVQYIFLKDNELPIESGFVFDMKWEREYEKRGSSIIAFKQSSSGNNRFSAEI